MHRRYAPAEGIVQKSKDYVLPGISPLIHTLYSIVVYLFSALLSLLTLPPALVVLKRYQPPRDCRFSAFWLSTQINSWLQFSVCIANYVISFSRYHTYLVDAPQEVIPFFLPYATLGNYFVISLGGIFLLELPFVMLYFALKVRQRTFPTGSSCQHSFRLLVHCFSMTGIVFFLQMASGYCTFFLFLFVAAPLLAVYSLVTQASIAVFLISFTAFLIYPCVAQNTGRKCLQGWGVILYVVMGCFGVFIFTGLLVAVAADNLTAPLNASLIATSVMSSSLLAMMAYIAKKTLWHHLWQPHAESKDEETPLLGTKDSAE